MKHSPDRTVRNGSIFGELRSEIRRANSGPHPPTRWRQKKCSSLFNASASFLLTSKGKTKASQLLLMSKGRTMASCSTRLDPSREKSGLILEAHATTEVTSCVPMESKISALIHVLWKS